MRHKGHLNASPSRNGSSGKDDESVSSPEIEASAEQARLEGARLPGEIEPVPGYSMPRPQVATLEAGLASAGAWKMPFIDAWFAKSHGSSFAFLGSNRVRFAGAITEQTSYEIVIGDDDRVRVSDTGALPWNCICSLLITARDGSLWVGTGWLAGPRTVMTAGHCVYMHHRGGWAREIEVIPGRDATVRPFGSAHSSDFRSVRGWTEAEKTDNDYGAIILPANRAFGAYNGYFGVEVLTDSELSRLKVNIGGYPSDKQPIGTLWFHSRTLTSFSSRRLLYDIDTFGGQSGAPVWHLTGGSRYIVGIHTNGDIAGNSATRVEAAVFNNIVEWTQTIERERWALNNILMRKVPLPTFSALYRFSSANSSFLPIEGLRSRLF